MSIFESILVRNGRPHFLREHLSRLRSACAQRRFGLDEEALENCAPLLRNDGFARIYVTAGNGSTVDFASDCRIFLLHEPRPPLVAENYQNGYALGILETPHLPLFNGLKTANYWANIAALSEGLERKKNETLLFNAAGELISACMANVFVIRDGRILTPSLKTAARAGVVREWVLQQRDVTECEISRDDLEAAHEIFLTSSWIGIMPASTLEERKLNLGGVAFALRSDYEETFFK